MTIYRGKGGKFASKAEIAAQLAAEQPALALESTPVPRPELKAFKGFNVQEDKLHCRGVDFEVGQETKLPVEYQNTPLRMCRIGFHASVNPYDVLRYYRMDGTHKFARVTLLDEFIQKDRFEAPDKSVGRVIRVDEELHYSHFINLLAKYTRDHPGSKPHYATVAINKNEPGANISIVTERYTVNNTVVTSHTRSHQLSNQDYMSMTVTGETATQVSGGYMCVLTATGRNTAQTSFGLNTKLVNLGGGSQSSVIANGRQSSIVTRAGTKFKGVEGTSVIIQAENNNPGFIGRIGENGLAPDTWYEYRAEARTVYNYKLITPTK